MSAKMDEFSENFQTAPSKNFDHHFHELDHLDQRSMDRSFESVKLRGNNNLAHLPMYIKVSCQKILSETNENDLLSFLIFPLLVMSHEPQMCMFSYLFGGMLFLFSMVFLH